MQKIKVMKHAQQRAEERGLTFITVEQAVRWAKPVEKLANSLTKYRWGSWSFIVRDSSFQKKVITLYQNRNRT